MDGLGPMLLLGLCLIGEPLYCKQYDIARQNLIIWIKMCGAGMVLYLVINVIRAIF